MESGDEFSFELTKRASQTTASKLCVGATVEVKYGIRHRPLGLEPPPAGKVVLKCRSLEVGDPKECCGFIRSMGQSTVSCYDRVFTPKTAASLLSRGTFRCLDPNLAETLKHACNIGAFVRFLYRRLDLGDGGHDGWANVITSIVSMEPLVHVTGNVQKTTSTTGAQGKQQILVDLEDGRTLVCRKDACEEWEELQVIDEGWTIKVTVAGKEIVSIDRLEDNGLVDYSFKQAEATSRGQRLFGE
jgi:hypothetical protein